MGSENISFSVTVPGKIILMGEHSVLYNKRGLAASIDKRTRLSFRESSGPVVTVALKNLNLQKTWDLTFIRDLISLEKPILVARSSFSLCSPEAIDHSGLLDIIRNHSELKKGAYPPQQDSALIGLLYVLSAMLWSVDVEICPFSIEISSDLTIGAGTGSSAAFSVSLASAVYHYIKLKTHRKLGLGKHNISGEKFASCHLELLPSYREFSPQDKEIINKWAYCIEKIMHGKPSGLDNTVCTYGNAVLINSSNESMKSINIEPIDSLPALRVLLVNTNVPRNTADLVKKVAALHAVCPVAMDSVLHAMDTVAKEFVLLLQKLKPNGEREETEGIYKQLEGLIDIQQGLLCTLGVSHTRLEEICMITKRRGFHSKLTGAGGGGYAFTLLPPYSLPENIKQCIDDLRYSGFHVEDIYINAQGLTLNPVYCNSNEID